MNDNVLDSLKELDILIKKRLFLIAKENGINVLPSPLQVRIFMYIYESEGVEVSQTDLVRELKVSKVSISEAISKMVNNGNLSVITSGVDARKNVITITEKGMNAMNSMTECFEILKHEIVKDISKDELTTFNNIIQCMKKNVRED